MLEFLYNVEIRPSSHNILTSNMDEKDRPSDVALLNGKFASPLLMSLNSFLSTNQSRLCTNQMFSFFVDGRLVVLVETSPDSREVISPHKTFVQVY